jgi:hypothetical protein
MTASILTPRGTPGEQAAYRPSGLARQVALMAAHRDSLATPHGAAVPLEQHHIDAIADRLSVEAPVPRPRRGLGSARGRRRGQIGSPGN